MIYNQYREFHYRIAMKLWKNGHKESTKAKEKVWNMHKQKKKNIKQSSQNSNLQVTSRGSVHSVVPYALFWSKCAHRSQPHI